MLALFLNLAVDFQMDTVIILAPFYSSFFAGSFGHFSPR